MSRDYVGEALALRPLEGGHCKEAGAPGGAMADAAIPLRTPQVSLRDRFVVPQTRDSSR